MLEYNSIFITGASSGIGAALALSYAKPSVALWLCGRDLVRLSSVAEACRAQGAAVETKQIDVAVQADMERWIEACDAQAALDLVIANAGVSLGPTARSIEDREKFNDLLSVNIVGVLNTVYPALDVMSKRRHGQIALVSSLSGYLGMPTAPAYSASKNFVKSWGTAIAPHAKAQGVSVSVICPGFVKSGITDKNKFPMPLLITAEKAAKIITRGLRKRELIITFPFPLRLIVWLISIMPAWLANKLMEGLPKKN